MLQIVSLRVEWYSERNSENKLILQKKIPDEIIYSCKAICS